MIKERMRVLVAVWFIFICLALSAIQGSAEDSVHTRLDIVLSRDQVEFDGRFFAIVSLVQSEPVVGVQIDLSFDASLVQVDEVRCADPVWGFFGPPIIDNSVGEIRGAGVASIGSTVSIPTDCFNISFRALDKDGIVTLSFKEIIVLNETGKDQIQPVFFSKKQVIIGKGIDSDDDTPTKDSGSSSKNDATDPSSDQNQTPILNADFTFSPVRPRVGEQIIFQVDSVDLNEDNIRCLWDFGDGNSSVDKDPIYSYLIEGEYVVSLTMWDNSDSTCTVSKNIIIEALQNDLEETNKNNEITIEKTPGYETLLLITSILIIIIVNKYNKKGI